MSNAAIIKQINLDENDYAGMLTEQRTIITNLRKDKNLAEERMRILYRENVDLKDLLKKNNVPISENLESNRLFLIETKKEEDTDEHNNS